MERVTVPRDETEPIIPAYTNDPSEASSNADIETVTEESTVVGTEMQSVLDPQTPWTVIKPSVVETAKRKTERLVKYIKEKGYPNKRASTYEERLMAV